jgi:hypothetical protein
MTVYKHLESVSGVFPKVCGSCSREYPDLKSFMKDTEPVASSTGLAEFPAEEGSNSVGVFRNCQCGSTMLIACSDRRDMSEAGEERRRNFDNVLGWLENLGVEKAQGRKELRKFIHGERSELLERLGLRR